MLHCVTAVSLPSRLVHSVVVVGAIGASHVEVICIFPVKAAEAIVNIIPASFREFRKCN